MDDVTSTRVLLEQHRAGDAAALNELYGRYTTRVLAVVRARLGAELRQRVQSLDIVQEAMLDSLKNLEKFDYASEGAFLKWLTAIVEKSQLRTAFAINAITTRRPGGTWASSPRWRIRVRMARRFRWRSQTRAADRPPAE